MSALGVREVMQHIHPEASPLTYMQSDMQEPNTSWIDFAMASTELLVAGLVTEAGVLQHAQLAGLEHKAYVIELDLEMASHLGAEWKVKPGRSNRRRSRM